MGAKREKNISLWCGGVVLLNTRLTASPVLSAHYPHE